MIFLLRLWPKAHTIANLYVFSSDVGKIFTMISPISENNLIPEKFCILSYYWHQIYWHFLKTHTRYLYTVVFHVVNQASVTMGCLIDSWFWINCFKNTLELNLDEPTVQFLNIDISMFVSGTNSAIQQATNEIYLAFIGVSSCLLLFERDLETILFSVDQSTEHKTARFEINKK